MNDSFKLIQNKPIYNLRHAKLDLVLSRHIRDNLGLIGAHITGGQQTGKSTYALMVMYELYQGDLDNVFANTVFTIEALTQLLNEAIQKKERKICVLWDDSSVHGGAGQYNINRRLVQYLSAIGDTMGIATKGLLLTSPSGDIVKAFRNYNFYRVQIGFGRNKYDRVARGYEKGTSPYGQPWYRHKFEDRFDVRLPFYQRYYNLREKLSISTLQDMNSFLKTPEKPFKMLEKNGKKYVELDI